jgi:hypothetical protein
LLTSFRTFAAGFGAALAMVMLVAAAFIGTAAAGFSTDIQIRMGQLTVAHQQAGCQEADVSTVAVQLYAMSHRFYFIFIEAGRGAGLTSAGACQQRIYKCLMLMA